MSVPDAIDLLTREWSAEVKAISEGQYTFWIGSGISRERFANVPQLILRVFKELQARSNTSDPLCPFRAGIREILNLAGPIRVDIDTPADLWPDLDALLNGLAGRYADILSITIRQGGREHRIFWDILELHRYYSDPAIPPDAEHEFLALLALEGIAPEIITTNWDALIERAHETRRDGLAPLKVVACSDDFDAQERSYDSRLLKIHGCAVKASADAAKYGPSVVSTSVEIAAWIGRDDTRPFREELQSLLRKYPAIFVGLSAQDFNFPVAWCSANAPRTYTPGERSRLIFGASSTLTPQQRTLLTAVYGYSFDEHRQELEKRSLLPLYGKPLLGGLYLLTLCSKCDVLIRRGTGDLRSTYIDVVLAEWQEIQKRVCAHFDQEPNRNEQWRRLAEEVPAQVSRFLALYRDQSLPAHRLEYTPVTIANLAKMSTDPGLLTGGMHLALFTIALMFRGHRLGIWELEVAAWGGAHGQFRIHISGRSLIVFVLSGSALGTVRLDRAGFVDLARANDIVVLYPDQYAPPRRVRSPRRKKYSGPTEIGVRDLLALNLGIDELVGVFKSELLGVR